jgi:hypothetical protein
MAVIYFDLNGAEVAERPLRDKDKWDDARVEAYLDAKFIPLAQAMETNTRPLFKNVSSDITSWMCAWCPVFSKCYDYLLTESDAAPIFLTAARERGQKK